MAHMPSGWWRGAPCGDANPDLFFPERGQSIDDARAVCHRCRARTPCLAMAVLRNEEEGVWGGLSVRERRAVRRQLVDLFGQQWLADVRGGRRGGIVDQLLEVS